MNRREFLQHSALGAGALLLPRYIRGQPIQENRSGPRAGRMIGMPISIAPLVRENLDALFADMRARAGVNALFPFLYTHEAHRGGVPEQGFHGGNYARPHLQYYRDVPLTEQDMAAPEFGGIDVLEKIIPVAKKHGIAVYPFVLEDNSRPATVPNLAKIYEVDHHGRRAERHPGGPCYNNPGYQNLLQGLVEDYARSYEIGGFMWGAERQSGFLETLGLSQSSGLDPGRTPCFCEFCQKRGRAQGIEVERARAGYDALESFTRATRAGEKPADGYFSAFWALLLQYPESLAWAKLWVDSRHDFAAAIYRRAKSARADLPVGWHVWHNLSFSPFQRAEENYKSFAGHADFLRPALYNNVAGERYRTFVKGAQKTVYGDLSPEEVSTMLYHELHYNSEAPYEKVGEVGFSADYVEFETRRAVEGVAGQPTQIWPGLDIDVPIGRGTHPCTPESVAAAVRGAAQGGAQGIILSRNYIEMKPENLSGAGNALRALGWI